MLRSPQDHIGCIILYPCPVSAQFINILCTNLILSYDSLQARNEDVKMLREKRRKRIKLMFIGTLSTALFRGVPEAPLLSASFAHPRSRLRLPFLVPSHPLALPSLQRSCYLELVVLQNLFKDGPCVVKKRKDRSKS